MRFWGTACILSSRAFRIWSSTIWVSWSHYFTDFSVCAQESIFSFPHLSSRVIMFDFVFKVFLLIDSLWNFQNLPSSFSSLLYSLSFLSRKRVRHLLIQYCQRIQQSKDGFWSNHTGFPYLPAISTPQMFEFPCRRCPSSLLTYMRSSQRFVFEALLCSCLPLQNYCRWHKYSLACLWLNGFSRISTRQSSLLPHHQKRQMGQHQALVVIRALLW